MPWKENAKRFKDLAAQGVDGLLLLPGLVGMVLLVWEIGWPVTDALADSFSAVVKGLVYSFGALVFLRVLLSPNWRRYLHRQWYLVLISLLALVLLAAQALFFDEPIDWLRKEEFRFFINCYFAVIQLLLISGVLFRLLRLLDLWWARKMRPGLLLIFTFLILIAAGTFLLKTPEATTEPITWTQSFFTSTSAVCVTGLIVVDTAERFTFTGQAVILVLIQLGGLGLMTLTYFFALLAGKGLSIRDRLFLRDLFSEDNLSSLGSALRGVVVMVVVFETIGAALLYWQWSGIHPASERLLWDAIFHSVSSFCNAGFSTFTENLAEPFVRSALFSHWTVMILIVFGGLGFPVLRELWLSTRRWIGQKRDRTRTMPIRIQLSLHTRLVLSTTGILLFGGMLLFLLSPSPYHNVLGDWRSYHEALFNSVTARTAGFNITEISAYGTASTLILILLMFIGGSPAGTAGGIKTTTAAIAFFNLLRILKGRREVELFHRRIPEETTTRAFAILLLSGLWIFVASILVSLFQPELFAIDVLFESISAFATVGLSRGITSSLSPPNQIILSVTMFVGRVGILLFICTLFQAERGSKLRQPEGQVIIN